MEVVMKDQKDQDSPLSPQSDQTTDASRRELLKLSGIAVGVAALGGVGGMVATPAGAVTDLSGSDNSVPRCRAIDDLLKNNKAYASNPANAGDLGLPIRPSKRVAVVACMDARLDVNKLLGLRVGEAHVIRNAGGVITEDAIRNLIISHHLLNTECWILIHHTRCGMLAFKDDLLRAGLEGDPNAVAALSGAVGRTFVSPGVSMADPAHFAAFRGGATPLDSDKNTTDANGHSNYMRLQWDVRRGLSRIINHPWTPTTGPDAVRVRGFIYDVDTGLLSEVFLTGAAGELGPFDAGLPFC
jgi:carbonic anhydrase